MTEVQREIRRKKRVIEYAEKIGHVGRACRHFGIARSTFYLWRDRYRESGDEGLKSRTCSTTLPSQVFVLARVCWLKSGIAPGGIQTRLTCS